MFNSFNLFDYSALAIATDPGKSYSVGRNGVMCHHSLVTALVALPGYMLLQCGQSRFSIQSGFSSPSE